MDYLYDDNSPIIACSSGNSSNTGISIIRLSGFKDFLVFKDVLDINFSSLKYRYSYYSNLIFENKIVDSVIAVFFKGPNTFNGENILELSVHGNILNVDKIINYFISNLNFRLSHPGEFTYRAYRNKKLSLSQVEGLDLLLNANSQFAINQGLSLLDGDLNNMYKDLHSSFIKHKSSIELSMDFYEDVGEEAAQKQLIDSFNLFEDVVKKLFSKFNNSINLLNPRITLLGEPNAGKSTLFNKFLNSERSIVSSIQGTTRDYICEKIKIRDALFELVDTAGIRTGAEEIEAQGISRTLKLASNSFYNILLIDINNPKFNIDLLTGSIDSIIFTHSDLVETETVQNLYNNIVSDPKFKNLFNGPIEPKVYGSMGAKIKTGPIEPNLTGSIGAESESGSIEPKSVNFYFSDNSNLLDLESVLTSIYSKFNYLSKSNDVLVERHKYLLFDINKLCLEYSNLLRSCEDISIISSEFNNIGYLISELIGIVTAEDILQNIFTNFCIGK